MMTACAAAYWATVVVTSLILTDLLQLDEIDKFVATCSKASKVSKVDNLQHVCGVFGCERELGLKAN